MRHKNVYVFKSLASELFRARIALAGPSRGTEKARERCGGNGFQGSFFSLSLARFATEMETECNGRGCVRSVPWRGKKSTNAHTFVTLLILEHNDVHFLCIMLILEHDSGCQSGQLVLLVVFIRKTVSHWNLESRCSDIGRMDSTQTVSVSYSINEWPFQSKK
jgi:hypothetical protein